MSYNLIENSFWKGVHHFLGDASAVKGIPAFNITNKNSSVIKQSLSPPRVRPSQIQLEIGRSEFIKVY